VNQFFLPVAQLIRTYLSEVCFGITAVALLLAGPAINGFFARLTEKLHWIVKYLLFVLLCTVGYGVLTQVVYRGLKHWMVRQHSMVLVLVTIGIYLVLAFFAKKQGHI
jgi:Na+-driven multidrug efflux pump